MLMIQPDEWRDSNNVVLQYQPISLLTGNRAVLIVISSTVYEMQAAGVQWIKITVADYIKLIVKNPLPNGNPTHYIPSYYNALVTAAQQ